MDGRADELHTATYRVRVRHPRKHYRKQMSDLSLLSGLRKPALYQRLMEISPLTWEGFFPPVWERFVCAKIWPRFRCPSPRVASSWSDSWLATSYYWSIVRGSCWECGPSANAKPYTMRYKLTPQEHITSHDHSQSYRIGVPTRYSNLG